MPYLTSQDIATHLYDGVQTEIHRGQETKLEEAITAAISEAESYLGAYDTTAIFATTGSMRHAYLLLIIKDMAVWHFIQLANPNVDMELRQIRYDRAIEWLKAVQKGQATPTLPIPSIPIDTNNNGYPDNYIKWGGNNKRNNNF